MIAYAGRVVITDKENGKLYEFPTCDKHLTLYGRDCYPLGTYKEIIFYSATP